MTLTELGFAISDGKTFQLTPKVLSLGMTYLTSLPFWGLAQHVLEGLSAQVKASVSLSVYDGQAAIYLLRIPSREVMSLQLGVGSRVPAYATSPGRVLLAWQSDDQLQRYFSTAEIGTITHKTLTDRASLVQSLEQVRQDGFSWVDGEFDISVCGLSVPVYDENGHVVAALSVNLLAGEVTRALAVRRFYRVLRAAAEQLRAMTPQFLSAAGHTSRLTAESVKVRISA